MRLFKLIPAPILVAATFLLCLPDCASSAVLNGTVRSGGDLFAIPLSSVPVTLYQATTAAPTVVATATSNGSGHFTMDTATTSSTASSMSSRTLGNPSS